MSPCLALHHPEMVPLGPRAVGESTSMASFLWEPDRAGGEWAGEGRAGEGEDKDARDFSLQQQWAQYTKPGIVLYRVQGRSLGISAMETEE